MREQALAAARDGIAATPVYMRLERWAHNGLLSEVLSHLQQERLSHWCVQALSLDSTIIKVHPDGCGARKKTAHRP